MSTTNDIAAATRHFSTVDIRMAELLADALSATNPMAFPTSKTPDEYFASIVRSIVSQQISVKAAAAIQSRVEATVGEITPERINATPDEMLRAAGLSGQKVKYLKHNALIWHELPSENFAQMDDAAIITELTKLYGIGRWTAEMFLIFSLNRPDVYSYGDLGLMNSLFKHYPNIKKHHVRKIRTTVESWGPHRSIASLTLWYHLDNEPVLL
jgi:DNA-3-methyladenine glycosylase II